MMKWMVKQVNQKNKGFTLIEMVVVLAIIAVLIAIAVPQVMKQINNSKKNADIANAKAIAAAIAQWQADGGQLSNASSPTNISSISGFKVEDYMSGGMPKPKLHSGDFKYVYDATTSYLAIYAPNSTGADAEVYPQVSSNFK